MNREMRHIAAERTVVMPIDELHRITVDQVGGVALLRWVDATVPPIVRQVVADRADEIDVTAVIADELVEAVVLRVIVLRVLGIAEMLLADDARGVPDGLRLFRQRDLTFLQALAMLGVRAHGVDDRFDARALLIAAGHQPGPGG